MCIRDRYYIAGRRVNLGGSEGYLFAATPVHALAVYIRSILTMFLDVYKRQPNYSASIIFATMAVAVLMYSPMLNFFTTRTS